MNRRHQAISLHQAAQASPVLANLASLTRDSQARLRAIEHLLPATLRSAIVAGPIDGENWCLLVSNATVGAKLRQLVPSMLSTLHSRGWAVGTIRIKVQTQIER